MQGAKVGFWRVVVKGIRSSRLKTEKTMADQDMEDAMIIIQEASAKIAKVS